MKQYLRAPNCHAIAKIWQPRLTSKRRIGFRPIIPAYLLSHYKTVAVIMSD
ncbi:hypothetical protein RMSM_03905 [Rhodopirellula maiorica SM1]|uniref:Uncharacterized protein n=1 Tax=Rhodopirellula maiorica SM1 TaxID=1265738 RepID=M5RUU6_9BACT|nr:hypothetical protein RMSM_03905 [Rhodopirellula maiorica SM1]